MPSPRLPPSRALLAAACVAIALQSALVDPAFAAGGRCGGCFAVVRGDGSVVRSVPSTVTVKKRGIGSYEVNFGFGTVDSCAYSVALRNGGNFTAPTGSITAGRNESSAVITVVDVATFNVAGKLADRGFHLVIAC